MGNTTNILNNCTMYIMQDGITALMAASEKGKTNVVGLLIEHSANVNSRKEVRLHALACIHDRKLEMVT